MKSDSSRRHFLKNSSCAVAVGALGNGLPAIVSAQAEETEIIPVELSHAWMFRGAGGNVFAVPDINGDGVLMIDGGLGVHSDVLIDSVLNTFGKEKIDMLINTHWHPEQTGSNERLGAEGAIILAHEKTRMFLQNSVESALFDGHYGPLAEVGIPNRTVGSSGNIKYAGQEIIYGYLPAAHSDSDLWLYFPMLDTLCAGGPVTTSQWPILDIRHGSWIGGLLKAYETLAQVVSADTVVIPAHGPIISGTDILRMRAMFTNLHLDLAEQLNLGMGPKNVVNMGLLDEFVDDFGDPTQFLDHAIRSMQRAFVPD